MILLHAIVIQGTPGIDGVDGMNGSQGIPGEPGRKGVPVSSQYNITLLHMAPSYVYGSISF